MINEKQTPIETCSDVVNFDDKDLEIKGQLFAEPILKTENSEAYARILISDTATGLAWGVTEGDGQGEIYFPKVTKEKLAELVQAVKNNISKYKI